MNIFEHIELIEEALDNDNSLDTAWDLTELGMNVLPVRCTSEKDTNKQKIPVYPYSSRNTLSEKDTFEVLEEAFKDNRYGIALSPHIGCGLIIIDADTPGEVNALKEWWKDNINEELPEPTIITPGMQNEKGEWDHSGGGHWYIAYSPKITKNIDPMEYSKNVNIEYGNTDKKDHFNIRIQGSYNILPPSKRSTGYYKKVGKIINGMNKDINNNIISEKLFELCKKKTKTKNTYIPVNNIERYSNNDGLFNFPAGMSLQEKITVWVETLGALQLIESTGSFSPDDSSTCGTDCVSLHYKGGSQSRSAVVHGRSCSVAPYGTVTVFSDSLKSILDTEQDVVSVWSIIKTLKYNGDIQETIHGEGLHTDIPYGGAEWMKNKFSKYKNSF